MSSQPEPNDVTCKQAYDLLFSYLEGELVRPTAEALEHHFDRCPPCRQFLSSYKATPGLAREALDNDVPPEVTSSLQAFLRSKISNG